MIANVGESLVLRIVSKRAGAKGLNPLSVLFVAGTPAG